VLVSRSGSRLNAIARWCCIASRASPEPASSTGACINRSNDASTTSTTHWPVGHARVSMVSDVALVRLSRSMTLCSKMLPRAAWSSASSSGSSPPFCGPAARRAARVHSSASASRPSFHRINP
jgi:hypothetical protein